MIISYLTFVLYFCFSYLISNPLVAQQFSKPTRLCTYFKEPSQYYPCALNYIGLNGWSLFRCPENSIFDERLQQCKLKVPPIGTLDQFAALSNIDNRLFKKVTSFILTNPLFRQSQPTTTPASLVMKRILKEKVTNDDVGGIFWANGRPLMKLNDQSIFQANQLINSKLNHFSNRHPYPPAIREDELKYKKICYFTNWSQYRSVPAKFEPENIDPFICTHIIYAFAYVNNETLLIQTVEENDEDLYRRINALKKRNPKLKTLLGVGGWNMKSYAFSMMVRNQEKRRNFIYDSINFLRKHDFDGLEADWEYPGIRGGHPDDKYYLTIFFQEFKDAAVAQSIVTGKPRLLIAAAVAASQTIVEHSYEIEKISKVLDFINIMTYDFHGAWQNHTGMNAPLYRRFDEADAEGMLNQDFGMNIWLKKGAPAHKLILGIPLFARSFLLARASDHELRSPTVGNGTAGLFTRSPGFLSYFEVCLLRTDPLWQQRPVVDGSESGYMFKDREWISYDTLENVQKRAAYVVANNFGGLFVWSLDMDDFNGMFCNNGTYPFIRNSLSLLPTNMPYYV